MSCVASIATLTAPAIVSIVLDRPEDAELIRRIAAGDTDGLRELYERAVDVSLEPDGGSPEHSGVSVGGGEFG